MRQREATHRIGVLIRHNTLMRLRDPGQMISYVVLPMVIMLMFKPLYEKALGTGTIQVVTGPLVMFSVFTLAIVGNSILVEREWRTWDRLRTSSASAFELLLGKTVPVFVILLVQQSVLLVYGCLVIGLPFPKSIGYVALAVVVWGLTLLAIGAALATVMRSHAELGMVSDLGAIVLSSIGGALVPVSLMPEWAQFLAHFSPGYWALRMLQSAVVGDSAGIVLPTAVLLAIALVAGLFAIRRIARGWGRSDLL
ncbi:ABC transporter permease [Saccharothrix sp. NRRL B-16314]|uniref:ABC transporter permease n=1 Tax=Saccharothrix sp. NRRL B-16314 TaxID=1463825 RepID=UPI00052659A3|nr:ABC transporter permease [Saccharothrix sp. NRRL B-16314]